MKIKKIGSLVITSALSLSLLVGCQSTNTSQNSNNTNTKKVDTAQIKTKYQSKLKGLVTKGTITQDQSDKILTTLTERMGKGHRGNGSNRPNNNNSTNSGNSEQTNQGSGNKQNFNPLNKLVQDNTITQDQANTVWEALRGSFNPGSSHSNNSNANSNNQ
ncbi:hypothetical protein [Clostridium felsineum]|uniref:hypothetical protein n=1 Tax=Clostridium felsineum TaxID=36839 RepID=UPI00098C9BFA|nr:hypothetical protein [Clostridium felsineum]URZ03668.1 hypothetical protein CLAUR_037290 [Clostridium felsineum]